MKLTNEQRKAVDFKSHAVITACPGSGKTRTIIAKVLKCIDELSGTPRKVACITYTNTAVYEIENRIRASGVGDDEGYHEVSTIHAFCQANILGKYYWKTEAYKDGYTVLPPDHDTYIQIINEIGCRYGLDNSKKSQFERLNRDLDGVPLSGSIPENAAIAFWEMLEGEGYIDFCNIIYHSYRILRDNPSIRHNISCRFAYVLVDEFQDTSVLQVELLKFIHAQGYTTFFLVGDPEQSIYGFAGAQRESMASFAEAIDAHRFSLSVNFRATAPLVYGAERLIPREPPMVSGGTKSTMNPTVSYEHVKTNFAAMTDYFLPFLWENEISYGDTAILAPNWFVLSPLGRQLRKYKIPVTGSGARPYKRRYLLGRIAEQVCAYLESRSPEILRQTEKELFEINRELTGRPSFRIFSYDGMRVVHRIMRAGDNLRQTYEGAAEWLNGAAADFEEILISEGVVPSSCSGCLTVSKDKMLEEISKNQGDVENMVLADLGMIADPKKNMKLKTMHSAKGREFEAVAIICAHDGVIPYYNCYNTLTNATLAESRRLFYVAVTRAKRALWIFSSDNSKGLLRSRFISELGLVKDRSSR